MTLPALHTAVVGVGDVGGLAVTVIVPTLSSAAPVPDGAMLVSLYGAGAMMITADSSTGVVSVSEIVAVKVIGTTVMVDLTVVTGRSFVSLSLCAWISRGKKAERQRPKIGNGDIMVNDF